MHVEALEAATGDDGLQEATAGKEHTPEPNHLAADLVQEDHATQDGVAVPAVAPVQDFVASFQKPLQQPLLSTPRLRTTRAPHSDDGEDFVPKRSARLATKSRFRAAKPEAQARKVMMKKLGFEVETEVPDEASFDEFQTALKLPLTPSKREAMQALFLSRKHLALLAGSTAE